MSDKKCKREACKIHFSDTTGYCSEACKTIDSFETREAALEFTVAQLAKALQNARFFMYSETSEMYLAEKALGYAFKMGAPGYLGIDKCPECQCLVAVNLSADDDQAQCLVCEYVMPPVDEDEEE